MMSKSLVSPVVARIKVLGMWILFLLLLQSKHFMAPSVSLFFHLHIFPLASHRRQSGLDHLKLNELPSSTDAETGAKMWSSLVSFRCLSFSIFVYYNQSRNPDRKWESVVAWSN